jgi:hypothetical protein
VQSLRNADRLTLAIDVPRERWIGGNLNGEPIPELRERYWTSYDRSMRFSIRGEHAADSIFVLRFKGEAPVPMRLFEVSYGLPPNSIVQHRAEYESPKYEGDLTVIETPLHF